MLDNLNVSDILSVVLGLLAAGLGVLYRASREERTKLRERLHESKRAMYEQYTDVLREVAAESKGGGRVANNSRHVARLREFAFRAPLIASDEVLKAHIRFTNLERISKDQSLPAIGDMLVALRRDIGFPDTKITARTILGIIVNELEDLDDKFEGWEERKRDWDRRVGWD